MTSGGGEEVGDELGEIRDRDAFAHWWICDDEGNGAGVELPEVGGDELGLDVFDFGGGEILLGDLKGFRAKVRSDDFGDSAKEGAFDEFEPGAAEGVPNNIWLVGTLALPF